MLNNKWVQIIFFHFVLKAISPGIIRTLPGLPNINRGCQTLPGKVTGPHHLRRSEPVLAGRTEIQNFRGCHTQKYPPVKGCVSLCLLNDNLYEFFKNNVS